MRRVSTAPSLFGVSVLPWALSRVTCSSSNAAPAPHLFPPPTTPSLPSSGRGLLLSLRPQTWCPSSEGPPWLRPSPLPTSWSFLWNTCHLLTCAGLPVSGGRRLPRQKGSRGRDRPVPEGHVPAWRTAENVSEGNGELPATTHTGVQTASQPGRATGFLLMISLLFPGTWWLETGRERDFWVLL